MSPVTFVNTAWRTHQETSKGCTGTICLLIKTREMPGEKKMGWGKDGSFQVTQSGGSVAVPCLSWAGIVLHLGGCVNGFGSAAAFSSVFLTG